MKKIVALFGRREDSDQVCDRLRAAGHQVAGYAPTLDNGSFREADVVVLDQQGALPSVWSWRSVEGVCHQKPVLLFTDGEEQRKDARRWGAYYVGDSSRSPEDVAILVGRAQLVRPVTARQLTRQVMIGEGPAMLALRRALQRLAASPCIDVLLRGESGSGKRTFARELHLESRVGGEFLEPTDPKEVEAVLSGGRPATVYLGDISGMTSSRQTRVCRALQMRRSSSTPVRFVAAVGPNSGSALHSGELRPALLHRFVVTLDIPSLEQRREDLPLLAGYLIAHMARAQGLPTPVLSPQALSALKAQDWPGNVRQLENTLQRALVLAKSGAIEAAHLSSEPALSTGYRLPPEGVDLEKLERDVLTQALGLARGNRTRAAALLGLTRDQVRYRLTKFEMEDAGALKTEVA